MSNAALLHEGASTDGRPPLVLVGSRPGGPRHFRPDVEIRLARVALLGYFALFAAAELSALLDIRIQAVLLAFLTVFAISRSTTGFGSRHVVGATASAVAAVRLFTVTVPFGGVSVPTKAAIVGLCSIAVFHLAWSATRPASPPLVQTPSPRALRLKRTISTLTLALVVPLSLAAFYLTTPEPLTYTWILGTPLFAIAGLAIALAVGALGEELLYRRLLMRTLRNTAKVSSASLLALVWVITYASAGGAAYMSIVLLTGFGLAWSYKRTASIRLVALAHAMISILVLMVWPALL